MSKGLFTDQLDLILRTNPRTKHPYVGTFPSDGLQAIRVEKYPSCYIINSDKSSEPGTHWLCVYVDSPRSVNFFDSYGLELSNYKEIDNFVHRIISDEGRDSSVHALSGTPLQGDLSDVCGHWCIVFVDVLSQGLTFDEFLNIFNTNSASTDAGTYDSFVRAYVLSDFCKSLHCNVHKLKRRKKKQRCICKYLTCCTL